MESSMSSSPVKKEISSPTYIYIYIYVWASIASNQLSYGLEGLDEWLLLSRSGQVRVDRQHHRPSFRLQFHRYTFAERDS